MADDEKDKKDVKDVKGGKGGSTLFTIMLVLTVLGIIIIIILFVIGIFALLNRTTCDECPTCPSVNCALSGSPYINPNVPYYKTSSGTCNKFSSSNAVDFDVINNSTKVFGIFFKNLNSDSSCSSSGNTSLVNYFVTWLIANDSTTYSSNGLFILPNKYLSLYKDLSINFADPTGNNNKVSFNGGTPNTTVNLDVPDPVNQKLSIVVSNSGVITVDVVNKT